MTDTLEFSEPIKWDEPFDVFMATMSSKIDFWAKAGKKVSIPLLARPGALPYFFSLFECKRCGKCCEGFMFDKSGEYIALTKREVNKLGLSKKQVKRVKEHPEPIRKYRIEYPCIFLSNGICSIYSKRPFVCRVFPLAENPAGDTFMVQLYCPAAVEAAKELYKRAKLKFDGKRGCILNE